MIDWLHANRPAPPAIAPADPAPVPDGAVMVKEMYPVPAEACRGIEPTHLLPTSGAAVMVRDAQGSHDGWYWGWFGWSNWRPDWPAVPGNPYPNMGFGQYCTNCHASAQDNSTFASLDNIAGEAGRPVQYLSQYHFLHAGLGPAATEAGIASLHQAVANEPPDTAPVAPVPPLPSQTYDSVWVAAHGGLASEFVTSDQCLGCHSAGGTGLQFMQAQTPRRLTSLTRSNSSPVASAASCATALTPALLNAASSRPKAATVRATIACTASSSATSQARPIAWPPARTRSSAAARAASPAMSASATAAPARAKARAVARPMPEAAPVTSATRPRKSSVMSAVPTAVGFARPGQSGS
jgi:hypothetical protein